MYMMLTPRSRSRRTMLKELLDIAFGQGGSWLVHDQNLRIQR